MPHQILDKPTATLLSSAFGNISILADGDFVDVRLIDSMNQIILAERYYAYNGRVTIHDCASLVEASMRQNNLSFAQFSLQVFTDSETDIEDSWAYRVLYCDRFAPQVNAETFLSENFLTTLNVRRIAHNTPIPLYVYVEKNETSYETEFRAVNSIDGSLLSDHFSTLLPRRSSAGIVKIDISVDSILDNAGYDSGPNSPFVIQSFTVRCGQRAVTFACDPELAISEIFSFRNCFNVWETAFLPCVSTAKTAVNRSTAIVDGNSQFYNQTTERTYQVEAGPLTSDEAEWIDQLFSAYSVNRIEPDPASPYGSPIAVPILITVSSCEASNGDDKTNSVKFTWRYAANRPRVLLAASPTQFSPQFNLKFS